MRQRTSSVVSADKALFMRRASIKLIENAACVSQTPYLFDEVEHNAYSEAAINICGTCTVTEECLLIVNPTNSYFDGVAGGIVFKNGFIVPKDSSKPRFRERS
jgi:hypothetical protein